MGTYHTPGGWNNSSELDLSIAKDFGVTCAIAVSGVFVEKIGFGNDPVIGYHLAHNIKGDDHVLTQLIKCVNHALDKQFESFGVPMSAILQSRPSYGGDGRQQTITDLNPNSPTRGNRKRLTVNRTYRAFIETGETEAFRRQPIAESLLFFDWQSTSCNPWPNPNAPKPPAHSSSRYGKHGRIRCDLLESVEQ